MGGVWLEEATVIFEDGNEEEYKNILENFDVIDRFARIIHIAEDKDASVSININYNDGTKNAKYTLVVMFKDVTVNLSYIRLK